MAGASMDETVRQRLLRWLSQGEHDFEDLRVAFELSSRDLEDALRHIERSVRAKGMRLRVTAPACRDCGFDFPGRARRHFHPPSHCPRCRGERITPPRFRVAP